ncbi:hypothetical protein [Streptosporangium sandarakinum]
MPATLDVRRVADRIGAETAGTDVSRPLDPSAVAEIVAGRGFTAESLV